jgi:hypothetical protein
METFRGISMFNVLMSLLMATLPSSRAERPTHHSPVSGNQHDAATGPLQYHLSIPFGLVLLPIRINRTRKAIVLIFPRLSSHYTPTVRKNK